MVQGFFCRIHERIGRSKFTSLPQPALWDEGWNIRDWETSPFHYVEAHERPTRPNLNRNPQALLTRRQRRENLLETGVLAKRIPTILQA